MSQGAHMLKTSKALAKEIITTYRVSQGAKIHWGKWDPQETDFISDKEEARKALEKIDERLGRLQELLFAEHKHKLLIVLQGMDTSGKDGVIEHVFKGMNPQGTRVVSFKAPSLNELEHDYLWRVHSHVPKKGDVVIFNRSHYEDVLIVRVHHIVPEAVWKKRFDQINAFEKLLADEGTTILKFYLHIDKDEQKKRLEERRDQPDERWKFRTEDLAERKLWPYYLKAYQDVLEKTSTPWAPWHIIPSNKKWYRNLLVASIITETLHNLKMKYPKAEKDISKVVIH